MKIKQALTRLCPCAHLSEPPFLPGALATRFFAATASNKSMLAFKTFAMCSRPCICKDLECVELRNAVRAQSHRTSRC